MSAETPVTMGPNGEWARLVSNQRPLACEAGTLPPQNGLNASNHGPSGSPSAVAEAPETARIGDVRPNDQPNGRRRKELVLIHGARLRRLPVLRVNWLDERRRGDCQPGPTQRGYRKGQPSPNKGKKFPPDPPTREEAIAILDELWRPGISNPKHAILGLRNRTLIVVLWRAGLRVSEALALTPADVDFDQALIHVRRGKGDKRRLSGIDRDALAEINAWLFVRAMAGYTIEQALFPVLEGRTKGGRMRSAYVRQFLKAAAKRAGVTKRVPPHQWRHAMAVGLATENARLDLISLQMGHSSPAVTSIYLRSVAPTEVTKVMTGRSWA